MDANPPPETRLHAAVREENLPTVAHLLEQGGDPNTPGEGGNTPLHLAARAGHRDIARLLLENGADLNIRNADGLTARRLARDSGYMGVVILLDMWAEAHHLPKESTPPGGLQPAADQREQLVAALKRVWIPITLIIIVAGCLLIYLISTVAYGS